MIATSSWHNQTDTLDNESWDKDNSCGEEILMNIYWWRNIILFPDTDLIFSISITSVQSKDLGLSSFQTPAE